MAACETFDFDLMIFCWIFDDLRFSFTRSSRSDTLWPEVARNFSNSAAFGNCCSLIWLKRFLTSLSDTLTPSEDPSPSTHEEEMRNPNTSCWSDLYCVSHCDFSCVCVGAACPLAGLGCVVSRCAIHAVNLGGSGITGFGWAPSLVVAVAAAAT